MFPKLTGKMKKSALPALALAFAFAFFSCSNDDGADYDYESNNAVVNFTLGSNVLSFDTSFAYDDSLLVGADNSAYSPALARFAFALAFDCYDTAKVSLKTSSKNPSSSYDNTALYSNFGFEDAEYVELSSSDYLADTRDLTNAVFAHKEFSANGKSYQIFTVAVQGSSGMDQWFSNFDVGDFSDAATTKTYATLSATHSVAAAVAAGNNDQASVQAESITNYTTLASSFATEHKGFALASLRLKEKFEAYVAEHEVSGSEKIVLLTGHSRGAAIANILGKVYEDDSGWTSFAYGFATPRTTTNENASSYKTIFNIVNTDDLVTELPLKSWGFTRYGTDKAASISSTYLSKWKKTLPLASDYVSANGEDTSYLNGVASDRADLYKLEDASAVQNNTFSLTFDTEDDANAMLSYLQGYGFGIAAYDPYSTFSVVENDGKYTLSATFRPQFFLNTLVMSICLASSDTTAAAKFVTTMCGGYSLLHKNALFTMSQKITGFAYSHSAPCYSILADNLE